MWKSFKYNPLNKADAYNLRILGGEFFGELVFIVSTSEGLIFTMDGHVGEIEDDWLYMTNHEWKQFLKSTI